MKAFAVTEAASGLPYCSQDPRLASIIYFKIIVIDAREEHSDETLPRE